MPLLWCLSLVWTTGDAQDSTNWVDHLDHLNHLNALGDFYQMFPFLPNDQSSPMELSLQLARKIPISVAQTPSPSSSLGQDAAICSRGFGLTNWSFCYLHLSGSPQVVEGLNLNKARQKNNFVEGCCWEIGKLHFFVVKCQRLSKVQFIKSSLTSCATSQPHPSLSWRCGNMYTFPSCLSV